MLEAASQMSNNRTPTRLARLKAICRDCALLLLGALTTFALPAAACECHLDPACSYVSRSDIIFVGKVTYSNDDGSGTFVQATPIRFEVEEAFKGLPPDVHEVWIDPGSFTSCYAEYPVGKRYLVFASSKLDFSNLVAMTIVNGPRGLKPSPPGFDPNHPPTVYLANECSGTREVSANTEDYVASDLAFLRAWKKGQSTTRVYGHVLDNSLYGWPGPNPAVVQGVRVTLTGVGGKQTAISDDKGDFSFDGLSAGRYSLDAAMDGHRVFPPAVTLDVALGTCGYTDFDMVANGIMEGIVKDHLGHPALRIELIARRVLPSGYNQFIAYTITDKKGAFRFTDLPSGDFQLGVNMDRRPTSQMPYAKSYYPGKLEPTSINLSLNEHRKGLTFTLPPPLKTRTVNVRVTWADSTPVAKANVSALWSDGGTAELAQTDRSGNARLVCLSGVRYQIEASKWLLARGAVSHVAAHSGPSNLPAEPWNGVIRLVLTKASHGFQRPQLSP